MLQLCLQLSTPLAFQLSFWPLASLSVWPVSSHNDMDAQKTNQLCLFLLIPKIYQTPSAENCYKLVLSVFFSSFTFFGRFFFFSCCHKSNARRVLSLAMQHHLYTYMFPFKLCQKKHSTNMLLGGGRQLFIQKFSKQKVVTLCELHRSSFEELLGTFFLSWSFFFLQA